MAIGDLLVGMTGIMTGVLLKTHQAKVVYKLFGILPLFGSMFVSIFSLGLMTLDRLIAVKYSLQYHKKMTTRRIMMLIALTWLIPILLTLSEGVILLHTDSYTELKVRSVILGIFFTFGSVSLFISNGILYHYIRRQQTKIRKTSIPRGFLSDETQPFTESHKKKSQFSFSRSALQHKQKTRKSPSQRDIKASTLCIWITVAFVACWTPLTGYRVSYVLGRTRKFPWFRRLCLCLASANSLVNPIIYFMRRKDFQTHLKRMLSDKKRSSARSTASYTSGGADG